jgi:hypothetical protein
MPFMFVAQMRIYSPTKIKHMRKALLTLCTALIVLCAKAQTLTWYDIINGIPETAGNRPECISILPLDNNTVIGGTSFGIYKTTDNGANWSLQSSNYFICHEIIKTNSGSLVAVGRGSVTLAGKHVLVSSNNGDNWNTITVDAVNTNMEIRDIVKDNSGNLYIAAYSNTASAAIGVYKSTDEGATWTKLASTGLPSGILFVGAVYTEDGNNILLGTNKGISKSTDGGATFTSTGVSDYIYRFGKTASGAILASGDDGIYVSTDAGTSFSLEMPTASFVFDFLVNGNAIIAAVYNGGIISYDADTYAQDALIGTAANGLTSTRLRAIAMNTNGDYFAATEGTNNTNGRKFHTTIAGNSTGINKAQAINFGLYPNPATGLVIISGVNADALIEVTDVSGKAIVSTVATADKQTLDLSNLANGMYYVQVKTADGLGVQKLQIVR